MKEPKDKPLDMNQHNFKFSKRWFYNRDHSTFCKYVYPEWAGKPLFYLEIGIFEGMLMSWMMEHIVTHPESKAVGIDPWLMTSKPNAYNMDNIRKKAFHNTSIWKDRCHLIRGNSVEVLMAINRKRHFHHGINMNTLDLCMIDGDHTAPGVWNDARLVYPLLKKGGWMMFDDVENVSKKKFHVKDGIKLFLKHLPRRHKMELLWKDRYMECYVKI